MGIRPAGRFSPHRPVTHYTVPVAVKPILVGTQFTRCLPKPWYLCTPGFRGNEILYILKILLNKINISRGGPCTYPSSAAVALAKATAGVWPRAMCTLPPCWKQVSWGPKPQTQLSRLVSWSAMRNMHGGGGCQWVPRKE